MKINIDTFNGDLTITVNKRHIVTDDDKTTLRIAINAMCHLKCFGCPLSAKDLDETIVTTKGIYIGFVAIKDYLYTFKVIDEDSIVLTRKYHMDEE